MSFATCLLSCFEAKLFDGIIVCSLGSVIMAMTIATGIGIGIGIGIQSTVLWDLRNRYYSATELNTETRFRKGEMI